MESHVTIGTVKPLGYVCGAVFVGCAYFAFRAGQFGPALGFLPFVLLSAYLVYSGYTRHSIDSSVLTTVSAMGRRYQLAWSEVKWIEIGTGGTLVFHGENKRLVFSPPAVWRGPEKPHFFQLMVAELEKRNLRPIPSNTADYKTNKNVRVGDAA